MLRTFEKIILEINERMRVLLVPKLKTDVYRCMQNFRSYIHIMPLTTSIQAKKKIKKKFLLHKIMKFKTPKTPFNAVQKRKKNNKKSVYLFFARIFILYKAYFCAIKCSKKTNTILCVYIIYHQNECVGSNTEIYLFCLRSYTLYIIYVCCEC